MAPQQLPDRDVNKKIALLIIVIAKTHYVHKNPNPIDINPKRENPINKILLLDALLVILIKPMPNLINQHLQVQWELQRKSRQNTTTKNMILWI